MGGGDESYSTIYQVVTYYNYIPFRTAFPFLGTKYLELGSDVPGMFLHSAVAKGLIVISLPLQCMIEGEINILKQKKQQRDHIGGRGKSYSGL